VRRAEGRAEGRAEAVITVLVSRGFVPQEDEVRHILDQRDLSRIDRWLVAAVTCGSVAELLVVR
jgi:hypothetical protein